jgi:hypothetical protein
MANVSDLAHFLTERREAYSGMPNRELADLRLAADLARLRLEYGDQIVDKALVMARRRPSPMTPPPAADRRR